MTTPTQNAKSNANIVSVWAARSKQRRALAGLNFGQLEDIGMSVADRNAEVRKGFWQA